MDNFQKYSRLMLLLVGGFLGFILFIALLIFIFRLLSITMIHIPGFDLLYQYVIIIIPYTIFFAAYYYLYNKIGFSKSKISRTIAKLLLAAGCIICIISLILSTALFFHVKSYWLKIFEEYSHYSLIVQIAILFVSAGVLASGDAKEKDWMERGTNAN